MRMERRIRTWVLALTSIASLMVALDTLVVSTALTTIREDLAASVEELEWTVNSYNLSLAVLLLPAAALGDRFGRRRLFAGGLALFTAASAACALSPDVGWLIAARAVQGVGAAFVLSLSLALVSAAYPAERRGSAIGILEGITGLAVLAGPTLRRSGGAGPVVGVGVLAERSDRPRGDVPGARPHRGERRGPASPARPAGSRAGDVGGAGTGVGAGARERGGLGQRRGHGRAGARRWA